MSNLQDIQFVDQAQLKQVMLANAEKADKRFAKKTDIEAFVKAEDLGAVANLDVVAEDNLSEALAQKVNDKYTKNEVYTKAEVEALIDAEVGELGALASLDVVTESELGDAVKNRINDTYTKNEVYARTETYTKDEVDTIITNKVAATYKAAGSIAFADLPVASAENLGFVFNINEAFTADERFVDPVGSFPAGTNVAVVTTGENGYAFDVLTGFVDLTDYVKFEDIEVASSAQVQDIIDSIYPGMDTNDDPEVAEFVLSSNNSLYEITSYLEDPEVTTVVAKFNDDITIPDRTDGKVTTTFIPAGKTVELDLNGHTLDVDSYAMYVNGGTLVIKDDTGEGKIVTRRLDATYPAVMVVTGKCIMESGLIDTTQVEVPEGHNNYMYGVVCSSDGIFEMNGGEIRTYDAACISITNGTAAGYGAKFIIGGDSKLVTTAGAAIYLADNKDVVVKDNAIIEGGIIARMGNIEVKDNAQVINHHEPEEIYDFGKYICQSGTAAVKEAILGLAGCYKTNTDDNDMDITISGNATVTSTNGAAVAIARLDTKYDQQVRVNIEDSSKLECAAGAELIKVYEYDELAALATASGKTLPAKSVNSDVVITVDGEQFYPTI